jgi:TM2 domain-containing membrane protein YozV
VFCRNCGEKYSSDKAVICTKCGVKKGHGDNYCPECGESIPNKNSEFCLKCGVKLKGNLNSLLANDSPKDKLIAGLLALFLGGLGIHRFYLGYNTIAITQLVLGLLGFVTCGITSIISAIWGLVDCILIFTDKLPNFNGDPLR